MVQGDLNCVLILYVHSNCTDTIIFQNVVNLKSKNSFCRSNSGLISRWQHITTYTQILS